MLIGRESYGKQICAFTLRAGDRKSVQNVGAMHIHKQLLGVQKENRVTKVGHNVEEALLRVSAKTSMEFLQSLPS